MPETCAYLQECNSQVAYHEAVESYPMLVGLFPRTSSEAHALAYVLKSITRRIERIDIIGDENALPLYTAISHMRGSVSFITSCIDILFNIFSLHIQ